MRHGLWDPDLVNDRMINRLELVGAVREGSRGARGRRKSARHYLDFKIDGQSLRELVSETGDRVTPLCQEWEGSYVAEYAAAMRGAVRTDDFGLAKHELEVLVCAECGDLECGAVVASVRIVGGIVTWDGFRWVQGAGLEEFPVEVTGAPFAFDRREYERLFAKAPQAIDAL
jgi:hypothetical protein